MLCVTQLRTHPNLKEQGDTATSAEDYEGDSKSLSSEEVMIHQPTLEIKEAGRGKPYQLPAQPTPILAPTEGLLFL